MSSSEDNDTDHILKECLLPLKSKQKYIRAYECFMRWKNKRNEQNLSEDVFLAYFTELVKSQKPSSLWAQYSMLKATMRVRHHVLIQNYEKLLSFLKRYAVGFKSQKSEVFTEDNILQFINEAPDEKYLATKVALIMGVGGACNCNELTDLTVNNIKTHGDVMLVQIISQQKSRMFIIRQFVPVVKKYQALRPKNMQTDRFFVNYRAGKCTKQVIGKNKFATLPKQVATYLKLNNPERYTGHCFRRSANASGITSMTDRLRQAVPLETLVRLNRDRTSTVQAENKNYEVDVKVEEMDVFEEEPWLRNEFKRPMEYDNDVPMPSQSSVQHFGVSGNKDIHGDTPDENDSVHIIEEEIETIDLSILKENGQPETVRLDNNITVNGNNITISFINCRNITINMK